MEPLIEFKPAVNTTDVEEARCAVGDIFCPHRLTPLHHAGVDIRLRFARVGTVGLSYLDYGTPVCIEPGTLDTFYLVQIPLQGHAKIDQGGDSIVSTPRLASVLSPDDGVSMEWGERNPQLILYVERDALHAQLGRMLGRPISTSIKFDLGMRMTTPAVQACWRGIEFLRDELTHESPLLANVESARQVEQMLLTRLLLAQPHNYTDALDDSRPVLSPVVRRARELIDRHLGERLTVGDIAEAVGVSVRGLQDGFRRDLDMSPTQYLRRQRMARAHDLLIESSPLSTSVTEIATSVGFTHSGRFAIDYRRLFGESPSRSLHRD